MAAGALFHDPNMTHITRMTEWSRLFSRTPQYGLENMGRERMLGAALRLQCDGSRLQTNIQDMNQFLAGLHEAASEVLRERVSPTRHGPVHDGRCVKPAHDAFYGSQVLVAFYEYSDMINSFQTLVPAGGGCIIPRVQRAANYMTAMGLWRPPSGSGAPGPLLASTCPSCMKCEYCLAEESPLLSDYIDIIIR